MIRGDCRCGTLRAPSPVASERATDPCRYSCVPPRLRFRMIPGYRRIPVSTNHDAAYLRPSRSGRSRAMCTITMHSRPLGYFSELPYAFEPRLGGRSNFSRKEVARFARHMPPTEVRRCRMP